MKPKHLTPTFAMFCIAIHAAETADLVIITDPSKILESKAYDLGDHTLTVQEVSKDALPMPPALIPPVIQLEPTPDFASKIHRKLGFLQLGGSIYLRGGQPARTLLDYRPQGSDQSISFWTSADWRLIAGIGNLSDANGKEWELICMLSSCAEGQQKDSLVIPEFSVGPSTIKIVSGNPSPEQLAPVKLFLAYYDANLPMLQAAYNSRVAEQKRMAAEEKVQPEIPEDIVVQFRVLAPEEIVPTATAPQISEK